MGQVRLLIYKHAPDLGHAFAEEVEDAAARAFPNAGSSASKNTKRVIVIYLGCVSTG